MSSLKLKHSGGNSVIIAGPSSNPAADRTINLNDNYAGNGSFVTANSSGNVGIGTTSPSQKLHVAGGNPAALIESTTSSGSFIQFENTSSSNTNRLGYAVHDFVLDTNGSERMRIDSDGNVGIGMSASGLRLDVQSATNDIARFSGINSGGITIRNDTSNEIQIHTGSNDALIFGTGGENERMRIDSSGKLFIGTTSTSSVEDGSTNSQYFSGGTRVSSRDNTSNREHLVFYNPNGDVGSINTSGSATSYTTSSDYRLKENATAISDGITRLKTLKPYRFNFKVDKDTTVDGFFAHEVTAVPEAITGTKDEVDSDNNPVYQGIDQSKLVPLLTAALQEAITEIETLKTKVAALEAG